MVPLRSKLVVGIGNRYRKDDGVGLYVARLVREMAPDTVLTLEGITDPAVLLDRWDRSTESVLVDCMVSRYIAGRTARFDALQETIPAELFGNYSTHTMSIVKVIELATVLDRLPQRLIVYGIEGEDFSFGEGLSPAVLTAANAVAREIINDLCGHHEFDHGRMDPNA